MFRTRQIFLAAVLVGSMLALVACNSGTGGGTNSGGASSGTTVTLKNIQFSPSQLKVASGATVTIENKDAVAHHIVIGTTDLGELAAGASATWTAPGDGVYIMTCLIHPSMSGQITVGAGGKTIGTPPVGGSSGGYGY